MVIETNNKDKPKNKSVLLFSGGMDSLIFNYLLNPDILLILPHGNKYEEQEIKHIHNLINKGIIDKNKVIFDKSLQLGQWERDDAIILNRNLFFITLATLYGETIYLGSVYGDRSLDKSNKFFYLCEKMFNYLFQDQHYCEARNFKIGSPYKRLTKTKLVKLYLNKGGNPEHLLESYSCYEGTEPCGVCKPCFRKWVSLECNNIKTNNYFKINPWEAKWLDEILPKVMKGEYRGKEDKNIIEALKKVGDKKCCQK